jgi:hypothetical protein
MEWKPSRAELEAEIGEKTLDLNAFVAAREIIRRRVLEVADSSGTLTPLPTWSGTDAVLGSLDLSIHAMERTIGELREMLKKATPLLTLVDGGEDGSSES